MGLNEILWIIAITLVPALELRASIPYGILKAGLPWFSVFLIAVVTNIILGIIVYFLIDFIVKIFTRIKFIDKLWKKYTARVQRRVHKAMEKYGSYGLAIFIGIPLPGSGVYTGCTAAYLLGLSFKKTLPAIIIGVLIAAVIVTIVTLTGSGAFGLFAKMVNGV